MHLSSDLRRCGKEGCHHPCQEGGGRCNGASPHPGALAFDDPLGSASSRRVSTSSRGVLLLTAVRRAALARLQEGGTPRQYRAAEESGRRWPELHRLRRHRGASWDLFRYAPPDLLSWHAPRAAVSREGAGLETIRRRLCSSASMRDGNEAINRTRQTSSWIGAAGWLIQLMLTETLLTSCRVPTGNYHMGSVWNDEVRTGSPSVLNANAQSPTQLLSHVNPSPERPADVDAAIREDIFTPRTI